MKKVKPEKPRKPAGKKIKAYKAERVLIDHRKIMALTSEETPAVIIKGRLCRLSESRSAHGYVTSTATFLLPDGMEIDVTIRYHER